MPTQQYANQWKTDPAKRPAALTAHARETGAAIKAAAQPQTAVRRGIIALGSPTAGEILQLQRLVGNRAVQRLLLHRLPEQADRPPAGASLPAGSAIPGLSEGAPVIQRTKAPTNFGAFEDDSYTEVKNDADREIGVEIKLSFTPDVKKVTATQIGLAQSVKTYNNGQAAIRDWENPKVVNAEGGAKGYGIDRLYGRNNPIYGTDNLPAGKLKQDTAPEKKTVAEGGKYELGGVHGGNAKPARLHDKPFLDPHGDNAGQEFETTALALDGQNCYYGSVRWGWRRQSGVFEKLALQTVSKGNPSPNFTEAAKKWNGFKQDAKFTLKSSQTILNSYQATAPFALKTRDNDGELNFGSGKIAVRKAALNPVNNAISAEIPVMPLQLGIQNPPIKNSLMELVDDPGVIGKLKLYPAKKDIVLTEDLKIPGKYTIEGGAKIDVDDISDDTIAVTVKQGTLKEFKEKDRWFGYTADFTGVTAATLPIPASESWFSYQNMAVGLGALAGLGLLAYGAYRMLK